MKLLGRIGRIFSTLVTILLAFILCANIYTIIIRETTDNPQPDVFGWSWAIVISGSMEPHIHVNDMVVVHHQDDYNIGDDVTFIDAKGSVVTHRIIEKHEDHFKTQGTANNTADPDITHEDIIGRVVFVLPGMGAVIEFFRTPVGMMMLLLVGVIIIELPRITEFVYKLLKKTD